MNRTEQNRTEQNRTEQNRLIGLDIFRISAAFLVFLFHSKSLIGSDYGVFNCFISMGAVAMTGFFMLSGYSLYYTNNRRSLNEWSDIKRFYLKRIIGLWPLYLVTAVFFIFFMGKETVFENIALAPIEVLGLQSTFSTLFEISHNDGTWFISCILLCYFVYPLFQLVVKGFSKKEYIGLLITLLFILLYSPFVVHLFKTNNIYSNPFFRILEFLLGVLIASYVDKFGLHKLLSKWYILLVELLFLILGISFAVKLNIAMHDYMLYSWIALPIFIIMIPGLAISKFNWIKNSVWMSKVLNYMSAISYAFFLAQFFIWSIVKVLMSVFPYGNIFKIVISIIVCTIISIIMHELIEKPSKKILSRKLIK